MASRFRPVRARIPPRLLNASQQAGLREIVFLYSDSASPNVSLWRQLNQARGPSSRRANPVASHGTSPEATPDVGPDGSPDDAAGEPRVEPPVLAASRT